jgi:hypothetical protein
MRQMTSDLDSGHGIARSNLVETDRKTAGFESQYDAARAAFVEAAGQLYRHNERFTKRYVEFVALGGQVEDITPPKPVVMVTIDEIEAYEP